LKRKNAWFEGVLSAVVSKKLHHNNIKATNLIILAFIFLNIAKITWYPASNK
jgi:hypothetical protein